MGRSCNFQPALVRLSDTLANKIDPKSDYKSIQSDLDLHNLLKYSIQSLA